MKRPKHYPATGMDVQLHIAYGNSLSEALAYAADRARLLEIVGYTEFYLTLDLPDDIGPEYTVNIFAASLKEE